MGRAVKIAMSIPPEVLAEVERERQVQGETRSQFFRRAVELLVQRARQEEAIARYERGYREQPERAEEVAGEMDALVQAGLATLMQEPWDTGSPTEEGTAA